MDTFFTTQEVADRLGVSVFTIRRYIRAGKLRAVKLDGVYRVQREELASFLREREIGEPADSSTDPSTDPTSTGDGESRGGRNA